MPRSHDYPRRAYPTRWRTLPLALLLLSIATFALLWPRVASAQTIHFVNDDANEGQVAHWPFDAFAPGDTFTDWPRRVHNATYTSAGTSSEAPPDITHPDSASLLLLAGNTITVTDSAELNLLDTFSVAAWVKRSADDIGTNSVIYDSGNSGARWFLGFHDDLLTFTTFGITDFESTHLVNDSNWHHVAFVKNGSGANNMTIYLDGIADSLTVTATVIPSGPKRIGARADDAAPLFGNIDELRIYNRALSAAEVQRLAAGRGCVNDGSSWANAFPDLQCALEVADTGDQVWVAQGLYEPGSAQAIHFHLSSNVALYGGFVGNESALNQRPNVDPTGPGLSTPASILSGDILQNDLAGSFTNQEDNNHHVVIASAITGSQLDGFTIRGGNARLDAGYNMGGALLIGGSKLTLANLHITGNQAESGGGIYALGSSVTASTLQVSHNAADNGGGIVTTQLAFTLTASHVATNTASNIGGGLLVPRIELDNTAPIDVVAALQVTDSTFQGNEAASGGGIHAAQPVNLLNTALLDNTAAATNALGGGGVFLAPFTMQGGRVHDNLAQGSSLDMFSAVSGFGGGLHLTSTATLQDVSIANNAARSFPGPGLPDFSAGGGLQALGPLTLENVHFTSNLARQGGGIAASAALTVSHSSFFSNTANSTSFFNFDNFGGALHLTGSPVLLANSLFFANRTLHGFATATQGAALYSRAADLRAVNLTIVSQSLANASAIAIAAGNAQIHNTIVTSHTIALQQSDAATLTEDYNLFFANTTNLTGTIASGGHSSTGDPHFVNDAGDFRLQLASPAVDGGDNSRLPAAITTDLAEQPRFIDIASITDTGAGTPPQIDRGAYELQNSIPTADAGGPYTTNEGQPIALDGADSSDSDSSLTTYQWDCTNNGSFEVTGNDPTGDTCAYPDNGAFTLRLRVTNAGGTTNDATAPVTVQNLDPTATNDAATTAKDTPVTINVLANDSDVPADPLLLESVTTPAQGSATIQGSAIRYTPAANYNGPDSFSYTVNDGDGGSATATVNVTVTSEDDSGTPDSSRLHLPALQN